MAFYNFATSFSGLFILLIIRIFLAATLLCGGLNLFEFAKKSSFFTFKRIFAVFLIILAARMIFGAIFTYKL